MTSPMTKFTKRMRHKIQEVEHRLELLMTASEKQAGSADKAIQLQVEALEDGALKATDALDRARADMAEWVDDAKGVVADWVSKLDVAMLRARADRSERYADATLVVALAGVDQAERAMLSAAVARNEADLARHP